MIRRALLVVLALPALLVGGAARLPSCTSNASDGAVARWDAPRVHFDLFVGADGRWDRPRLIRKVQLAMEVWSDRESTGSSLEFVLHVRRADGVAARDGTNAIVFRDDMWCPQQATRRHQCYPEAEAARTQTYVEQRGGAQTITESDIQINAVHYDWDLPPVDYGGVPEDLPPGAAPPTSLSALVLHELGHSLNLTHPCAIGWRAEIGSGLPRCAAAEPRIRASTLFPLTSRSDAATLELSEDVLEHLRRYYR